LRGSVVALLVVSWVLFGGDAVFLPYPLSVAGNSKLTDWHAERVLWPGHVTT
jgi:hypothetical protein